MSVSEPGKIITPWAQSGLKNPIPPAANPATGRAGFDQGFSAINMTAKEAGGIPPFGQDFNGIFYEVTNILRYMQAGGQPTFDAALAAAIGGYSKGATILSDDGQSLFISDTDSNTSNPNLGGGGWVNNIFSGQFITLEQYGVSALKTPEQNAAAFVSAVTSGKQYIKCFGTYEFNFDGEYIPVNNISLNIDMGGGKHVFQNFGGLLAPELIDFKFSGRLNSNGTFFRSLMKANKLRVCDMPDFELSDVIVDNPVANTRELKVFDISSSGTAPGQNNELMFIAGNMRFARIHTKSASVPQSGFTAFGNRGFVGLEHQIHIANLEIQDWYSTDTAGNYVKGESDFFRMYTNPLNMEIGTLSLINAAHRVFKFKNVARVHVGVCNSYVDGTVIPADQYTAVFTTQSDTASVTDGSIITIDTLNIDHPRLTGAGATAGFWSSDGLNHSMKIGFMRFKNFNAFVSNATGGSLIIDGGIGEGLSINAPTLDVAHIKNLVDTKFVSAACKKNIFENCELTPHPDRSLSGYPINNAYLWSTNFNNWKSDLRVAFLKDMRDCSITYTSGAAATIPFRLDGSTRFNINRFVMAQTGGVTVTGFADSVLAGAQALTYRDVSIPNATSIAYLTAGTWSAVFDNCTITTTTGAGVTTKKVAQYV